jgi:putative transposase
MSRSHPGRPVWQRNYYDRIIRSEHELHQIRIYIRNNPAQWDNDENNPVNYIKTDF